MRTVTHALLPSLLALCMAGCSAGSRLPASPRDEAAPSVLVILAGSIVIIAGVAFVVAFPPGALLVLVPVTVMS